MYQWIEPEHVMQLRVMPNEPGTKSRTLIDNPEYSDFTAAAWFPDGRSVLEGVEKPDKTWELVRVSVADGSIKLLQSLGWRVSYGILDRPQVSPDGRYVVYTALAENPKEPPRKFFAARIPENAPRDQHIYVLAVDGSGINEIVKTSGINRNPVWGPDGKRILFTSDRLGKDSLWSIPVQTGKAAGAASLVTQDISRDVGDFSSVVGVVGGSYYYAGHGSGTYIHVLESLDKAAPEIENFVGTAAAWSPDGKSIAFKRSHAGGLATDYDLVVHSIETGDERTYLTKLGTTGNGAPIWSQDGKSIVTGIKLKR